MTADYENESRSEANAAIIKSLMPRLREFVAVVWHRLDPPGVTAEDLLQLTVRDLLGRLNHEPSLGTDPSTLLRLTWVIARRRAIDEVRRSQRLRRVGLSYRSPLTDSSDDRMASPATFGDWDDLRRFVLWALEELESEERLLLRQRFLFGLTLRTMAEQRGVTHQSVAESIERSLRRLRRALRRRAARDSEWREAIDSAWPISGDAGAADEE